MKETFSIPGVGAIIERVIDGERHILIQERHKDDAPGEAGLMETPAGKIRAFESIFEALRREVREETGLEVTRILGEEDSTAYAAHDYRVIDFAPFCGVQNTEGYYPIMCFFFRCEAVGEPIHHSDETRHLRWESIARIKAMLDDTPARFYPMTVQALRAYMRTQL